MVVKAEVDTMTLKDEKNNVIAVDPQACTAGNRRHWKAQEPGQFRTAEFTFSPGDFAYRRVDRFLDRPPTTRANGILCCIRELGPSLVHTVDVWTGKKKYIDPQELLKPPEPVLRMLDKSVFHTFRREVLNGYDQDSPGVIHQTKYEEVCYGYDQTLVFPERQREAPEPAQLVSKEVVTVPDAEDDPVIQKDPRNQTEAAGATIPLFVALAIGFILFSQ